ncbi:hypothetical protein CK203_064365 [Vitis vinifera]|uniref:SWIM-type domain-containing protein n=1 Tax=Vitis vinifera TaxID=29760 RepID=A0A438FPJ4_VITVI|nr:hypothetical protein CK203_064365 [Vitis vinifera]
MSGPYGGALFLAATYNANDSMFPLAFGVMSSKNYEDWSWFLQNLKKVVAEKEVVIISDRHPALLRSVLEKYNDALATWVLDNSLEHWAMSKFPKQRWDKMTTNFTESFNVCIKSSPTIGKGSLGPQIEEKVLQNIAKGEVYPDTAFMNGIFRVCIDKAFLNVDIMKRTCTCSGWQMFGIPCEHASTVILSIGHNVADFVDDCYKFPMQELIY